MAELVLDEINSSVQAEGWIFNTEYGFPMYPNSDKELILPPNTLAIDSQRGVDAFFVIREGKVYDKGNHTFEFEGIQYVDVVWLFDFVDLPEAFKNYITIRAANVFAGRSVGSSEAVSFGQREEVLARATALEYDTQQGDYNIFQDKDGYTTIRTYKPINAIPRF